ncbi:MAG: hypothetical protein JWL67_674 [Solirubrobacterales bacterium]|nr:hypothetical protein [Solirubrobacterales bacterium]
MLRCWRLCPGRFEFDSATDSAQSPCVGKRLVVVAFEIRGGGSGRLRLAAPPDASTLGSIVHTDGWGGYLPLSRVGYDHRPIVQHARRPDLKLILPRAHRALSNLKTWLQGTHRHASDKHLQDYLDEFVFRHNRRRTPMAAFQTLLVLGATSRRPRAPRSQPHPPEPTGYS